MNELEKQLNEQNENHRKGEKMINNIKIDKNMVEKNLEGLELLECIGYGSESKVHKGQIKSSKVFVSMKMVIKKKDDKKNLNEIIIGNKLKNKNIINIYGVKEIKKDEIDCILMEYAKHGNIKDFQTNLLKKNYLSESIICFLTFQILNGLKYCHTCKVAHFDIKPQNIVIDDYLTAKIIDFSISLDYSKIKKEEIKLPFRGTNFFMAPEVLSTQTIKVKDLNKIDLFSLGVTLYYLAFDSYPFGFTHEDVKDYPKIYEKIMKGVKIENKDNYYSKYFIDFLTKLLEKDINKRININEALNHYWVKGAEILINEKEKIYNAGNFLSYLITDHIKPFDDYIL